MSKTRTGDTARLAAPRTRRARLVSVAVVLGLATTLIMPGASTSVDAYWGDSSKVTASPVELGPLPQAPQQASGEGLNCDANNGLVLKSIAYSWKAETRNDQPLSYSAEVVLTKNGQSTTQTADVLQTNGVDNRSVQLGTGLLGELIGSLSDILGSLFGEFAITVKVTAKYADDTVWSSSTSGTGIYNTGALGLVSTFSCS